ncbi:DUF4476 domain-containing protein [Hymenobacter sp. HMF4947]|uniref:DUF4476 domain-containing protein n=1 Tax=Hymenobacter ginkgonis TaxID=2682976 RepID=A0A7K1TDD9_9BACT|nr:DUF4476 domain-containing protein [Hymenobacter ginkgonis]MVN76425.1 DUF4476 domain-containing protein [Hymenobacter ginkgonis]
MKTLFKWAATAVLAWVTTAAAVAAPPTAITISSERGQPFSLVLDGRLLTRPLARQVHLDWLAPGRHWADFSVPTAYGPPLRFRTAVWLEPGLATSYVLVIRPPYGPQLQRVGAVALGRPAYGPGGYGYPGGAYPPPPGGAYGAPNQGGYYDNGQNPPMGNQGTYPGNGQVAPGNGQNPYPNHNQQAPINGQNGYPDNGQNPIPNGQGNYPNGGQYPNGAYPPQTPNNPTYPPAPGNGANGYPNQSGDYPAPNDGYAPNPNSPAALNPLSADDLDDLVETLRHRASDDDRLDVAKQTLDQSSVRAQDLAELLRTLTADEARVELAIFGYAHVTDPQNFGRVYGALQSQASVQQVQQAIGNPQ